MIPLRSSSVLAFAVFLLAFPQPIDAQKTKPVATKPQAPSKIPTLGPPPADPRPPNELGRVMILEYHKIEEPEARWSRTPENLLRDLERLWERGYRLVGLSDFIDGKIDLPKGTSPVILTFDDSSPGQFRMNQRNGKVEIDPTSAVAILERFAKGHPEFGLKATFFVLPGVEPIHRLFGQPEFAKAKLEYLIQRGFELGNHTLWHAQLGKYPEATVRKQVAMGQKWVTDLVPGYRMRTLALPLGSFPKDLGWAISGTVDGVTYRHDAILRETGGAAWPPYKKRFDPYRLPRIQALESEIRGWLRYFDQHPEERYLSDGDPTAVSFPKEKADQLKDPLPPGLRPTPY